jgi:NitT/TauT family transport system permease protein
MTRHEDHVHHATAGGAMIARLAAATRPAAFVLVLILLWDAAIRLFHVPPYLVPAPLDVLRALISDGGSLLEQAVPTLTATILGFLATAVFGVPMALLIASSRTISATLYPLLVFSQSIPKVAIAPLFVVWFGFGLVPKVISAFLLGFFPVVVSTVQGLKAVEPGLIDMARSIEASRWQIFRLISLPSAAPAIFSGLKVSVTLCVVGAVVGEFVGSNNGLGFVLQRSIGNFELPLMFAALVMLAMIGVVLFWLVEWGERLAIPWHTSQAPPL